MFIIRIISYLIILISILFGSFEKEFQTKLILAKNGETLEIP